MNVATVCLPAVLLLTASCKDKEGITLSAAPFVENSPQKLSSPYAITLQPLVALGQTGTGGPTEFGFVLGVAIDSQGSFYVLDAKWGHVAVFDSTGTFKRYIGRRGTGTGEFVNPTAITVSEPSIIIYDSALHEFVTFDTSGVYKSSRNLEGASAVIDVVSIGPSKVAITAGKSSSGRFAIYDLTGGTSTKSLLQTTSPANSDINVSPTAGRACKISDSEIVFANPFLYELTRVSVSTGRVLWKHSWESDLVGFQRITQNGASVIVPKAALLGLACSNQWLVFAYLDRKSYRLYYDVFDNKGEVVGRLSFARGPGQPYPGFLAGIRNTKLVTFRTKPFSQVFVYQMIGLPSKPPT
jgi:hypothetical protein